MLGNAFTYLPIVLTITSLADLILAIFVSLTVSVLVLPLISTFEAFLKALSRISSAVSTVGMSNMLSAVMSSSFDKNYGPQNLLFADRAVHLDCPGRKSGRGVG